MENNYSILNNYLVDFFNTILKIEEHSLQALCDDLSLREMHTIEAIVNSPDGNVGSIAAKLKITVGTLSVALKTLESKGYIVRERAQADRRQVNVIVTAKGTETNNRHQVFHHAMVNDIIECLSAKELETLMIALDKLNRHFDTLGKLPT